MWQRVVERAYWTDVSSLNWPGGVPNAPPGLFFFVEFAKIHLLSQRNIGK
jgi:hypothetical protein